MGGGKKIQCQSLSTLLNVTALGMEMQSCDDNAQLLSWNRDGMFKCGVAIFYLHVYTFIMKWKPMQC